MQWLDELKKMKRASQKTTHQIALESDIPEPTLEKLFAGKTPDPRISTISRVVHCLGYTLDDLYPDYPVSKGGGPLQDSLLHSFAQLNREGQERLVDTADDMVASGKYKQCTLAAARGGGIKVVPTSNIDAITQKMMPSNDETL